MATYTFKLDDPVPLVMRPSVMPTDAELRVSNGATCIPLTGTIGAESVSFDLSGLTLPPRLYRASIYFDFGDGLQWSGDLNLSVMGGC